MNKKSRRILHATVILLLLTPLCFTQQSTDKVLKQCVPIFESTDESIEQILGRLAKSYNVPVGLEKVASETATSSEEGKIFVKVESGTVRDVLDAVIQADPRYEWKEADGVINVRPREAKSSILEIAVHRFQINDANWMDARQAIRTAPEFRSALEQMGLIERSSMIVIGSGDNNLPKFSLNLRNTTLKGILNEILKAKGCSFWVFSRYGNYNQYVSIQAIV